ncbi:choice-of-anchor M domain-containing protein [Corynebacterium uterequi]|uniref:Actinobacterial surface-anchored protein domain n=1 Tax=Corynebacterium uterequi TaxID=1072256 RepID=A0A0G3HFE0_9CORY|nr:choice-of-anchor M domain-containing protein [Corynebacterium uterequi]AKK12071.1 actinobacterial surface-anchored protein domain [Corynebacterium uterequi]
MISSLRRRTALTGVAALTALTALAGATGDVAAQPVDPALEQNVTSAEPVIVGEPVIIPAGHVDMGPYLVEGGELDLLIRDDASAEPVWRHPEDVVFEVGDAAGLTVPDDDNYSFIGAKPGENVWVVPQTEIAGVPWVGWNTQSPTIDGIVGSGVTLEFISHDGPGEHSVFLQSGGFAAPDVLWTQKDGGSIWVEPDTHTHANWVFTEPGSHAVTIRATIEQPNGTTSTADATLRFAVGIPAAEYSTPAASSESAGVPMWLIIVGAVVVALAVVGGVAAALFRGKKK